MAQAIKLLDPGTGTLTFRDCITGIELTAAQIATLTPCPERKVTSSDACIQPIGNTDPTLVETNGKYVCTLEVTFDASGAVAGTAMVGELLLDAAGVDVTATHERTDCADGLVAVGQLCYS